MNLPDCVVPLIDAVWKECRAAEVRYESSGETKKYGIPPKELWIMQATDADWKRAKCKEPYSGFWQFSGSEVEEAAPFEITWRDEKPNGMYWRIGLIQFVLDVQNQRSVYHYTLGPRYGRGYKVTFDDFEQFRMRPDRDRMLWVS
ncbi:hypothetical protein [Haloferula sp. A504]|uniref:hypothetical protein n=1 Tax=Haloferula sp. A504 TaxID=3373601 RepID=UPI0031C75673|nr:hypothetical protein [Verrucomicrobiaceae bacterium E54]